MRRDGARLIPGGAESVAVRPDEGDSAMNDEPHARPLVLVVDDEPFNFDRVELAIGAHYRLEHVVSGEQALARRRGGSPHFSPG